MDDLIRLVEQIIERIREGKVIVVHCNGGKGRTGLVVVATLCGLGMSVDDAVKATRAARPGMIQNPAQVSQMRCYNVAEALTLTSIRLTDLVCTSVQNVLG